MDPEVEGGDGSGAPDQMDKMPEISELSLQKVENSMAFSILDNLRRTQVLTADEVVMYKEKYRQLHEMLVFSQDQETRNLKLARGIRGDTQRLELDVEKMKAVSDGHEAELKAIEEKKDEATKDLLEAEQRDNALRYQVNQLEIQLDESQTEVKENKEKNHAMVQPELDSLEEKIGFLKRDQTQQKTAHDKEVEQKGALLGRLKDLETEKERLGLELAQLRGALQQASAEPERARRQVESVAAKARALGEDARRLGAQRQACARALEDQGGRRQEREEARKNLRHKLELHEETIDHKEAGMEAVAKQLELERAKHHHLQTTRAELELARKEGEEALRRELDTLQVAKKEAEAQKRRARKKRLVADGARALLPQLEARAADGRHQLRAVTEENKALGRSAEALRQEVDVAIARFLRQEGLEREKRDGLDLLVEQVEALEGEIAQWGAEERKQAKLLHVLSAQREIKAREAMRAQAAERDTREQVKVKELAILDLTKRCNDVNNRLKEFSALYDVVKNERNKYVNLIQASNQALAEMKEKIKILQNEVDILRNESAAKDKALQKEKSAHQASQAQRDGLRLELNKAQTEYRRKQEVVEQQIVEIEKLNALINALERGMLRLKARYEGAVESRNFTGVQLIDSNDQLCVLYEKANLQESLLKAGELALRGKEGDARLLRLNIAELQRQVEVTRKQLPQMPQHAEKILQLQQELALERVVTDRLCRQLEDPGQEGRWRALEGEDPDADQLAAKIQVLEARLNEKKEAALEKELVLEEVTALTSKLRQAAGQGREGTVDLAKKVNDFQARIRDTTRRMMATVAELSMYQATALKLQQEKHARQAELEEASWRFEHDEPPSAAAEREWHRLERHRLDREEAQLLQASQVAAGPTPATVGRTTAEPRPNAYIPEDNLGLPRPYGAAAPFKPTEAGSTMRHVRPPREREIEI